MNATVIDPWRKGIEFEGFYTRSIINYGNTRPEPNFQTNLQESQTYDTIINILPEIANHMDDIYLIPQREYIHHTVETLVSNIKTQLGLGKTKVLFSCPSETLLTYDIKKLHVVLNLLPDVDTSTFYLVTGAFNGTEAYKLVDAEQTRRLNIISVQLFEQNARKEYHVLEKLDPNLASQTVLAEYEIKLKEKKFVCFNKVHRLHRVYILASMLANKLIDESFFSFEGGWSDWINQVYFTDDEKYLNDEINKNSHIFPLRLNLSNDRLNPIDTTYDDFDYFKNSYFSLVTETVFFNKEQTTDPLSNSENAVFFSEKIFKSILSKHPFVLAGVAGSLKALQSMGYKTFHPFIDESYDTIVDDKVRLKMIVKEVERLCAFTDDQWIEWQTNVKPIIDYNFEVFKNKITHNPDVYSTKLI
jgi:hypothetical protein